VDYPASGGLYILASPSPSASRRVVEHVLIHTKVITFRCAKNMGRSGFEPLKA
jgi:hypothetical protein